MGFGGIENEVVVGATGAEEGWDVTGSQTDPDAPFQGKDKLSYNEWKDHDPGTFKKMNMVAASPVTMHSDPDLTQCSWELTLVNESPKAYGHKFGGGKSSFLQSTAAAMSNAMSFLESSLHSVSPHVEGTSFAALWNMIKGGISNVKGNISAVTGVGKVDFCLFWKLHKALRGSRRGKEGRRAIITTGWQETGANTSGKGKSEGGGNDGLISGHSYGVGNIILAQINGQTAIGADGTISPDAVVPLLLTHNPWGSDEWTGPYGDKSDEFGTVYDKDKKGLTEVCSDHDEPL